MIGKVKAKNGEKGGREVAQRLTTSFIVKKRSWEKKLKNNGSHNFYISLE